MSNPTTSREVGQLRELLILARELLQSDDTRGAFAAVGKALAHTIHMDRALFVVGTEGTQDIVGFDSAGAAREADAGHPLYGKAMECTASGHRHAIARHGETAEAGGSVLALGVPINGAVAALVSAWERDLDPDEQRERERAMAHVAELALAALGKIQSRTVLAQIVWNQHAQLADTAEAHAAEMARRDQAESEMRFLSLTDVLTGLRNRRGFFLQAEQIFKVAQRQHAKSAVIFADVDDLKIVNDELGHAEGDKLIRDAALIFRESFRSADVVARLGGDEFVAFTLDDEHPDVVLERIRQNLHAFNLMQERPYTVSFSTGIVQCDPAGEQALSDYLLLADQQMYTQKRRRLH